MQHIHEFLYAAYMNSYMRNICSIYESCIGFIYGLAYRHIPAAYMRSICCIYIFFSRVSIMLSLRHHRFYPTSKNPQNEIHQKKGKKSVSISRLKNRSTISFCGSTFLWIRPIFRREIDTLFFVDPQNSLWIHNLFWGSKNHSVHPGR